MSGKYIDPRDIASMLEDAALKAELCSGGKWSEATVTISAELAYEIAAHLYRAPLKRWGRRHSLMELGYRNALVQKARRYKAELVGAGKSATEAEAEAAERFATVRWSAGTILRIMQRKPDPGAR